VSTNEFEGTLRGLMKAHAAEFDRVVGPAPQLRTILAGQQSAGRWSAGRWSAGRRSSGRVGRFTAFRLSVAVAAVAAATFAVVVLALIFGSVVTQPLPKNSPLSSVTPSPLPLVSLLSSPSTVPAGPTVTGGGHKASVWR